MRVITVIGATYFIFTVILYTKTQINKLYHMSLKYIIIHYKIHNHYSQKFLYNLKVFKLVSCL